MLRNILVRVSNGEYYLCRHMFTDHSSSEATRMLFLPNFERRCEVCSRIEGCSTSSCKSFAFLSTAVVQAGDIQSALQPFDPKINRLLHWTKKNKQLDGRSALKPFDPKINRLLHWTKKNLSAKFKVSRAFLSRTDKQLDGRSLRADLLTQKTIGLVFGLRRTFVSSFNFVRPFHQSLSHRRSSSQTDGLFFNLLTQKSEGFFFELRRTFVPGYRTDGQKNERTSTRFGKGPIGSSGLTRKEPVSEPSKQVEGICHWERRCWRAYNWRKWANRFREHRDSSYHQRSGYGPLPNPFLSSVLGAFYRNVLLLAPLFLVYSYFNILQQFRLQNFQPSPNWGRPVRWPIHPFQVHTVHNEYANGHGIRATFASIAYFNPLGPPLARWSDRALQPICPAGNNLYITVTQAPTVDPAWTSISLNVLDGFRGLS
ncbi:hypothetical protein J6590_030234 [Homalodisca vitripennis]|nr:hypothetical protein J6590_030234 [Homalodisca vitripennis]